MVGLLRRGREKRRREKDRREEERKKKRRRREEEKFKEKKKSGMDVRNFGMNLCMKFCMDTCLEVWNTSFCVESLFGMVIWFGCGSQWRKNLYRENFEF